jgi:hypothetical protein
VLILECVGSLAGVAEASQTTNDVTIVNAHRTDEDGTIEFITDGERLWVRVENQENSLMAKHLGGILSQG